MAARRALLANIRDDDVVTFAPVATPVTTLTAFVFADCAYCQTLYSQRDQFVAMGVKIRFVPVAPLAAAEGVACASDRRAALSAVMAGGALPPRCATPGNLNYQRLATSLGMTNAPTIFSETGTVVVGYTTPEELVRVLEQAR
jgi:thiol:disulfide interchange protein DsbC